MAGVLPELGHRAGCRACQTASAVLAHAGRLPHEVHAVAQHAQAGPSYLTALGPACALQAPLGTASPTQRRGATPMPAVRQHWTPFARKSHCLWVVPPAQQQQVGRGPLCRLNVLHPQPMTGTHAKSRPIQRSSQI